MDRLIKVILSIVLIFVSFSSKGQGMDSFFVEADDFFKSYVSQGRVDYDRLSRSKGEINAIVTQIANADLLFSKDQEVKAFYLNAYNLLVISSIIDAYPMSSVLDDAEFFSRKLNVAGESLSLNQIKADKLTGRFYGERFFFALSDGFLNGPELQPWAFNPSRVDRQLNEVTRLALNNPKFIDYQAGDDEVAVPIFFEENLKIYANNEFGLIEYFNEYRDQEIPPYVTLKFVDLDRGLNIIGGKKGANKRSPKKNQKAPDFFQSPLSLLPNGYSEVKLFNNLYTQTGYYNDEGEVVEEATRSTYLTSSLRTLFGVGKYVNVGFDFYFKSVRIHDIEASSFEIFKFSKEGPSRAALAQFGPSIKFTPIRRIQRLSIISSFLIPTVEDLEGMYLEHPFLSFDAYNFFNQIMVDLELSPKVDLFGEVDASFYFNRNGSNESVRFQSPVKMLLLFYPASKVALYGLFEWAPEWQNEAEKLGSFYMQRGVGFKYRITPITEIEFIYTDFFKGKNQGAGTTVNGGLRVRI